MTTLILLNLFLVLGVIAGLAALMRLPFHLGESPRTVRTTSSA
jgi:hypothetical protein